MFTIEREESHVFIYFIVYLSVQPINIKTAEPIGPKFCVESSWPQGRFMERKLDRKLLGKVRFL